MKPRMIGRMPDIRCFLPVTSDGVLLISKKDVITMTFDELEALRLVDYKGLLQEEAAKKMGVSRGTLWRCLDSARKKVASMLAEGRELVIISGEVYPLNEKDNKD